MRAAPAGATVAGMEFNCPSCDAPHAFPDEQVPPDGIVVACTACATHITLDSPAAAEPDPPPPEEPKPTLKAGDLDSVPLPSGPPAPRPSVNAPMNGMAGGQPSFGRKEQESRPPPRPAGWPAPPPKREGPPAPKGFPVPMADSDPPAPIEEVEPEIEPESEIEPDTFGKVAEAARDVADAGVRALEDVSARAQGPEDDVPEGLAFPGFKPATAGVYTWRDLPRAFLGLVDVQRLGFSTAVLWVGMLAFGVVNWVGALLAEKVWAHLGTAFGVVGWLVLIAADLFVTSVVGYVCNQTVVEQRSSSIKAGINWTQSRLQSVFGTPLAFVAVIVAVAAFHGLIGLLGRIPYAGPIIWGLGSGVTILSALAAGVVAVLLGYTLALYIPVIYYEKTGPAETLKRLLGLARGHGANLVALVLASAAMISAAFTVILRPAILIGTTLMAYVGVKSMGADLGLTIVSNPFDAIGGATALVFQQMAGMMGGEVNVGHKLGGFFTAFFSTGALAFVVSLLYVPYLTAGGIIYGILTGKKKA